MKKNPTSGFIAKTDVRRIAPRTIFGFIPDRFRRLVPRGWPAALHWLGLVLLPLLLVTALSTAADAILDQTQTTGDGKANLRGAPDRKNVIAQTFTPSVSGRLVRLDLASEEYLWVNEHPTTIAITDTRDGAPGTNILAKVVVSHLPSGLTVSFADQDVYLEAEKLYAIVLSTPAPPSTSQLYTFVVGIYDPYPRGMLWHCAEGSPWEPASFVSGTTMDLVFATYMMPETPTIRLISPTNGSLANEGELVKLEAAISSSIQPPVTIAFYASGELLGFATTPPYWLDWTPVKVGEVDLTATLTTSSGVVSTSAVVRIKVRPRSPANDDFKNRSNLAGDYAEVQFSNLNASTEPGEVRPDPATIGSTVWWQWTPPRSANAVVVVKGIGTTNAVENAVVSAAVGSSVDALWLVASGRGQCSFKAEIGESYQICVDSVTELVTNCVLVVALNDVEIVSPVGGAEFTAPASIQISGERTGNSREISEVQFFCNEAEIGHDSDAPYQLVAQIDTPGYYSLYLETHDETGVVTQSEPVNVVVHPSNDQFENALEISGHRVEVETSNVAATREGGRKWPWTTGTGEPMWADNQGGHSIWYRWKAPESGTCTISGQGERFELLLSVHTGDTVDAIMPMASNAMGMPGPVTFDVVAGQTYFISVDGFFGEEGLIHWSLRLRPKNDDFVSRTQFGGSFYETVTSFRGATLEPAELQWTQTSDAVSLWWSWTAPVSSWVSISARSPTGKLNVSVFTGQSLSTLQREGETAQWSQESVLRFFASEGVVYQFAVFGSATDTADFTFSLRVEMLELLDPADGAIFQAPAHLTLSAAVSESFGRLLYVDFIVDGKAVGRVESPPYVYHWTNVQAGTYTIRAEAASEQGSVLKSMPATVLVYSGVDLPTPRIWAAPRGYSSYVMNAASALYLFGDAPNQFGIPEDADLFWPQLGVPPPMGDRWLTIIGQYGLTEGGLLYRDGTEPVPVPADAQRWMKIVPGYDSVLALTDTGCIYEYGVYQLHFPAGDSGWVNAAAGNRFFVTLDRYGQAYLHAPDWYNKLQSHQIPLPSDLAAFREIQAGIFMVVLLGNNDQLYQMTTASFAPWMTLEAPQLVDLPQGVTCWRRFSVGGFHVLAIGDNGELYAWGRNYENQLGIGSGGDQAKPALVPRPDGVTGWSDVSAGYMHSLAIGNDGNLYAWGPNYMGELGIGHLPSQPVPARVSNVGSLFGYPVIYTTGENVVLPDGSFKVRFKSDLNRIYLIQYSDDMETWKTAQPPVNGVGGVAEWIDDGPPKTDVHPSQVNARFYRIVFAK